MHSSVCPCTLLELHVGSPGKQPTGAISAHVMALTHKPSLGRSVSQKRTIYKQTQTKLVMIVEVDEVVTVCVATLLHVYSDLYFEKKTYPKNYTNRFIL